MSDVKDRISAFKEVQASKYQLTRNGINDCNCVTKSKQFGQSLGDLGIKWCYGLVEFYWADLAIPTEIISIPHDEPAVHKHVEILIPESNDWVIVDPTWDPGLGRILPIPEWDGLTATGSAVPVKRTLSETESNELYSRVKSEDFRKGWFERNNDFVVALNEWLESSRIKS